MEAGGSLRQGLQQPLRKGQCAAVQLSFRVEGRLQTELGGPELVGFGGAALQFLQRQPIGALLAGIAAEGAEAAVEAAVVAGVEVAVHHKAHRLPHQGSAQGVGGSAEDLAGPVRLVA